MKTMLVKVEGRVQGVWFRDFTQKQARKLGLAGWVCNRLDGSVETEFTGEEESIKAMLGWLQQGSPQSRVDKVSMLETNAETASSIPISSSFEIRY